MFDAFPVSQFSDMTLSQPVDEVLRVNSRKTLSRTINTQ